MNKTIYVGNIQWDTSEEELKTLFSRCGKVDSATIIRDKENGRSKGYAFISMENADRALQELNGCELRGRSLKVNVRTPPSYGNSRYEPGIARFETRILPTRELNFSMNRPPRPRGMPVFR